MHTRLWWIFETPTSSALPEFPRLSTMIRRHGTQCLYTHTFMSACNCDSAKDVRLFGTAPYLQELHASAPKDHVYPGRELGPCLYIYICISMCICDYMYITCLSKCI